MLANPKFVGEVHPGTKKSFGLLPQNISINAESNFQSCIPPNFRFIILFKKNDGQRDHDMHQWFFWMLVQYPDGYLYSHVGTSWSLFAANPLLVTIWYLRLCSYFLLLDGCVWVVSRNLLLANLNSPLSSFSSLLPACSAVVAAYCSLIALGSWYFQLVAHQRTLLLDCCYSRVLHIHFLDSFRWRYWLSAARWT